MKLKTVKIKYNEFLMQIKTKNNDIKMNYCIENNAGDSFNKNFINDYFNKSVGKYTFGNSEHYLFCGSILSRANKNSIVIGAGLISEHIKFKPFKKLVGCRGRLTLNRLKALDPELVPSFLGDPGLMVNEIFNNQEKKTGSESNLIGVIPHFVDYEKAIQLLSNDSRFRIIDIKQDYKDVCNEILKCKIVLSSSLHGLIFSDGLSVKNNWIKFSDKIIGGDFKFRDYYSVMDVEKSSPIVCQKIEDFEIAAQGAFISANPHYSKMINKIREYFE
ncbi:MAG: polysaccharide pyruvyl transferase family protein [Proteus vulgaris]